MQHSCDVILCTLVKIGMWVIAKLAGVRENGLGTQRTGGKRGSCIAGPVSTKKTFAY